MGEWIYRTDLHASWMSLMFFINIIFILVLFKIDAGRLKALLNLLKPLVYFGKYGNDKELNYFTFFNLFSFLIVSSALALGYFSFSSYTSSPMVYDFEFFYLLFGLIFILLSKHLIANFLSKEMGYLERIRFLYYRNFTYATQFSIILMGLLFLWNYSSIPLLLIETLIVFTVLLWIFNQIRLFFSFFKSHPQHLVYIILYLCTFKIAPWFWVYYVFIETKL
jgi:hypothetical protein